MWCSQVLEKAPGTNVIKIDSIVFHTLEDLLWDFLIEAREPFQAHGQALIIVFTKRCDNNTAFLGLFIQLKGIVL